MENTNIDFTLGLENIKRLPFNKYEKDFTFIVDGKKYQVNRLFADVLSPNISKLHFTDSSSNEYYINTKDNAAQISEETDYFQEFLSLTSYHSSILDTNHQKRYYDYFYQLGNIDECIKILQNLAKDKTPDETVDTLISIISTEDKIDKTIDTSYSSIQNIISYIASHFEEINKDKLKRIKIDMLHEIFLNKSLKLSNEDSLFEFILTLYKEDPTYSPLFECVIFKNISQESFEKFINEIEFEHMNGMIWNSISCRFVKSTESNEFKERYDSKTKQSFNTVVKNHTEGREFDGIIKYLTEKTGGNIHDNGTIEVTSNSIKGELNRVVDHQNNSAYCSKDDGGAILCFDFKNRRINLTSYSMLSWGNSYGTWQLKNWVIEVSDDGKKWIEIDRHENDETLKKNYFTATFNIKNPSNEFKRFLRLRQTGNGWDPSGNHNVVGFNKIEFYGTLQEP